MSQPIAHRQSLIDAARDRAWNYIGDCPLTADGKSDPNWESVAFDLADWEIEMIIGSVCTVKTAIAAIERYVAGFTSAA